MMTDSKAGSYMYDAFVKRIRARWKFQNKNWLTVVCGETGSGKSYSALAIAHEVGESVYIVFSPVEFLKLLTSNKLEKGDAIVFDEAGVGMSARDWYSVQNKILGSVLQTFRHLNLVVIFTVPNLSFIDVQARKLFHNYFETANLDYKLGKAWLQVYDIQVNSRFDKIYYKSPKFIGPDGVVYTMSHLVVDKIPDSIAGPYEEKKEAFTKKLNMDSLKELTEPKGGQQHQVDEKSIQDKVKKNIKKFTTKRAHTETLNHYSIATEYGIPERMAYRIKKSIEYEKSHSQG